MSDPAFATPFGLAGLLSALQPRVEPPSPPPPPDLDAIHAAGWQQGFAAGEAAATAALASLRQHLAGAAKALEGACTIEIDRLRPLFVALASDIAATVMMAEAGANDAVLLPLVEAALALVRIDEVPVLRAHPDTLAALQPHLPVLAVAADTGMSRDEFAVTGPIFIIETGLSVRLAEIVAELA